MRPRATGRARLGVLALLLCLGAAPRALAQWTGAAAERSGPGPFAVGAMIQGDPNNADGLTDDLVSYPRGTQIGANFYANMDADQGSIVLWWTPEYGAAQLAGPGDHYILPMLSYEYDTDSFTFTVNDQSLTVPFAALTAGTTYNLVARWDRRNTLDGTNYASLSIDDVHNFGITTAPSPFAPGATLPRQRGSRASGFRARRKRL